MQRKKTSYVVHTVKDTFPWDNFIDKGNKLQVQHLKSSSNKPEELFSKI